jgi:hypothetical protein
MIAVVVVSLVIGAVAGAFGYSKLSNVAADKAYAEAKVAAVKAELAKVAASAGAEVKTLVAALKAKL